MPPLETRPTRIHRYGYVVLAALCALGLSAFALASAICMGEGSVSGAWSDAAG